MHNVQCIAQNVESRHIILPVNCYMFDVTQEMLHVKFEIVIVNCKPRNVKRQMTNAEHFDVTSKMLHGKTLHVGC